MRIFVEKDEFRGLGVLTTAEFAGVKFVLDYVAPGKVSPPLKDMPIQHVPAMVHETLGITICESNAICKLIATLSPATFLYGESLRESPQVDMWVEYITNSFHVPLSALYSKIVTQDKAKADFIKVFQTLDKALTNQTYLTGHALTVADIITCVSIVKGMKDQFITHEMIQPYASMNRWLMTICQNPAFIKHNGKLPSCCSGGAKPAAPAAATPSAAAPQEDEAPKKPAKCDLDLLPPPTMDLNEWKRVYSNTKDLYGTAMPWLWSHFDKEGYCFYYMKYEKLEDECTVPFVTSNQLGGFLQRIDNNFRKYSFAVIDVVGENSSYDIVGVWMFRGSDIPTMMKEHPSFEYNLWKKLDPMNNKDDRTLIDDYFCSCEQVEARPIVDSKVYK